MKPPATDTPGAPAKPRRRAQRMPDPYWSDEEFHDLLLLDEKPDRVKDICRVVLEKFQPKTEYDHYLANVSAANTYLLERLMSYEQRLTECQMLDQASQVDARYHPLDTDTRVALAYRDSGFLQSMRHLGAAGTTCLRRALLINNELRKPAPKE